MGLKYLISPRGILKIVELVFVIIAFGIFRGGNVNFGTVNANYFACGVMVTSMIITPLILVCYLMGRDEIQKSILEPALNFLLFVFLLSASAVAFSKWHGTVHTKTKARSMAMASFCLFSSVAYLVDLVFSVQKYRE